MASFVACSERASPYAQTMTGDWTSLRGLLIDLDGCVFTGHAAIPGSAEFIDEARRRGWKFQLVTNNSTASPRVVAERLREMNIHVEPDEVLTSAQAAVAYVRAHAGAGARVRIVGEAGLRQAAVEQGFVIVEDGEAGPDWVIAGLDRAFSYDTLTRATRDILAGARFVATNADVLLPVETARGQVIPGAGSIVAAIKTATSVEPVVLGKPAAGLFEVGLERLGGLKPSEAAMVGDRLDTDIEGARRAGLRAILVLSGVTSRLQAEAAQLAPDAVLPDLASVAGLLGW